MIICVWIKHHFWFQQKDIENIMYKRGIYFINAETVNRLSKRLRLVILTSATAKKKGIK